MSNAKSMNERQPKDERLSKLERQLNAGVSSRLQEKYNAWSKGKPKKETTRDALAKAIEKELGVSIAPDTVKKHLSGDNESAVSLPILCWYAQKFGTSVNYLLTATDDAPKKQVQNETATVSDALDSLRVLLDTFGNVIEFSAYQKDVTICVPGECIGSFPHTFLSLEINSEEIQRHLSNWKRFDEIARSRPDDDEEELRDILFERDLEKAKSQYDSISKQTGVFYNADEQPAFVKPLSGSDAVCVAVPKKDMPYFEEKFIRWEKSELLEGFEAMQAITEPNEITQDTCFAHDSMWNRSDIRKLEREHRPPSGWTQYTSHADDEDNKE